MRESPDVLDQSRREARLSHGDLWLRYFESGGRHSPMEVEAYLYGALVPSTQDHDLVVEVLNERFSELGRGQPIPYSDG